MSEDPVPYGAETTPQNMDQLYRRWLAELRQRIEKLEGTVAELSARLNDTSRPQILANNPTDSK